MSPKLKRCLRLVLGLGCCLGLLVVMGWVFAPAVLVVDSGVQAADALVVLGGDSWTRPARGAEVFQESRPTIVIVSGNGDCQDVRRQMEAKGVPASAIVTECDSKSTHENALYTVKLLRERHCTNVVIVTSWFHSRRALACFRKVAPEIAFSSRPTVKPPSKSWWPEGYERKRIAQEYAKIIYYQIFYGVSSW